MSEKWTIRELTPDEYPDTQLRYEVRDETDVVSLHYWEEDAMQMAAVPRMLKALEAAYSEIFQLVTTSRMIQACHTEKSGDVLTTIAAAIAAAKGE